MGGRISQVLFFTDMEPEEMLVHHHGGGDGEQASVTQVRLLRRRNCIRVHWEPSFAYRPGLSSILQVGKPKGFRVSYLGGSSRSYARAKEPG